MTTAADDLVGVARLLVDRPGAVRAEERLVEGGDERQRSERDGEQEEQRPRPVGVIGAPA